MSFYSFAPYLKSERGHDLIYHQLVESVVKNSSMTFDLFLSNECSLDLPLHWSKYFRRGRRGLKGSISRFREFKRLISSLKGDKRTFFLESFQQRDLFGLTLALLTSAKPSDRLLLLFRNRFDTSKKKKIGFSLLLKLLSLKLKERLIFLTDSSLILTSLPTPHFLLPIPHTDMGSFEKDEHRSKLTLLWPGAPRAMKGLKEIQRLLKIDDNAACHFELAASEDADLSPSNFLALRRLGMNLNREEYLSEIHKADIILLPYDPKTYQSGTSGIFVEAIIAKKMPVVKDKSWLSFELSENNLRELIVDWQDPLFFTHLLKLYENEIVLKKLSKMHERYLEFHSYTSFERSFQRALKNCQTG